MSEESRSTPDLSKIVSMIMERPELVAEIAALGKDEAKASEPEKREAVPAEEIAVPTYKSETDKRTRLLYALKPYLSESRAKAIDSMLTFGEVFDMMRSKK